MGEVLVDLGSRSYTIHIGYSLFERLGEKVKSLFPDSKVVMIITNPTVRSLYGRYVQKQLEAAGILPLVAEVPDGEEYKSLSSTERLYDLAYSKDLDRKSPILALGGGVIGDLAGFVAATYLRGVPLIQVPTTLLAQVDSSVGGKVAVNHPQGKNIIGAFYQPAAVIADLSSLKTLNEREIRAGLAEVIKYGVIADSEFFTWLEDNLENALKLEPTVMEKVVSMSCQTKAAVVQEDETDQGRRAILNYGHTVGHAVESLSGYGTYRHGEAVAIGMVAAAKIAERMGLIGKAERSRIESVLVRAGLPVDVPACLNTNKIIRSMYRDKKVVESRLTFVLPVRIGRAEVFRDIGEDTVISCLASL